MRGFWMRNNGGTELANSYALFVDAKYWVVRVGEFLCIVCGCRVGNICSFWMRNIGLTELENSYALFLDRNYWVARVGRILMLLFFGFGG
ncbi:hypothetical protein CEXT_134841 [Caerostris extrusa]|uniref:Uncharacterized protein n=1 Tax=Caerostris extrusa TaxID=172846 RepID=A0AAV4X9Q6_CAEEX|nr:hypothetical protein CEXT_134841 [Caerostris extrusa]